MSVHVARRALRAVGALVLGAFLLAAFTPLPNAAYGRLLAPADLPPADAVVVLGAGVGRDGVLGDHSLRRALHGILVFRRGIAPLLVMLGPGHPGSVPEAAVRAQLARELGVPASALHAVAGARTTREEAQAVRALLAAQGGRRIVLVTGLTHMRRARALFESAGLEVAAAPADEVSARADRPQERLELTRLLVQELVARVYHRLAGYL